MNNEIVTRNQKSFAAFAKSLESVAITFGYTNRGTTCALVETPEETLKFYITKPAMQVVEGMDNPTPQQLDEVLQYAEIQSKDGSWIPSICSKGNGGLKNAIRIVF